MNIKKAAWKLLRRLRLGSKIILWRNSFLKDKGWFGSFDRGIAVDRNGRPIPWLSYTFINFIEPRLRKDFTLFEYGSGNSTLWFAERMGKVVSVEHNKEWVEFLKPKLPANCTLHLAIEDYANEILRHEDEYHLVLVDAIDRAACARAAVNRLLPTGVIVLDNAERLENREIYDFLEGLGFRSIDFEGMAPATSLVDRTTVFYREGNCLNI